VTYDLADVLAALVAGRPTNRRAYADGSQDPEVLFWRRLLGDDPDAVKTALAGLSASEDHFVRQVMGVE
jgi:hypothetical protein